MIDFFKDAIQEHFSAVAEDPRYYTKRDMNTWRWQLKEWSKAAGKMTTREDRIGYFAERFGVEVEEARERYSELRNNLVFEEYWSNI